MKTVYLIAAARPNFIKIAPLYHAFAAEGRIDCCIVHTGQHYDPNMSDVFFQDLNLPRPHFNLNIGSGSHAEQTAFTMIAYEKLCTEKRPDLTIVVGDVNATMACAIASKKLHIDVAHVEAGLRSGDRTMPEEINRLLVDSISDLLFTPSLDANENLIKEGVDRSKIHFVGNIMIDSYEMLRAMIDAELEYKKYLVEEKGYGVVTLHRPSNVDCKKTLESIVDHLIEVSSKLKLLFPAHPRTHKNLEMFGLLKKIKSAKNIFLIDPLSYIPFLSLVSQAKFLLTDSGGVQEETTYLGIPCLTLRDTTERPITVTQGTNALISVASLSESLDAIVKNQWKKGSIPAYWDGKTANRILNCISTYIE